MASALIWIMIAEPIGVTVYGTDAGRSHPVRVNQVSVDVVRPACVFRVPNQGVIAVTYTINRLFKDATFEAIDARTRAALANNGFGILTEIDVAATMKKKLDVDMPPYRILGACNPKMAHQAIGMEPRVGAMLPCNVILHNVEDGIEVSAIDPVASMQAIDNAELHAVAGQVRDLLKAALEAI
jgi:uncharacterized protein (DUF302 family)